MGLEMPYHVAKTSGCPASKPWGVIKNSDGKIMGCHASKADANKQLAALYANEPDASNQIRWACAFLDATLGKED